MEVSYPFLLKIHHDCTEELNDPNGICKDISGLGRWGNGDVELFMEHQDELDQIMEIVKQSYDAQAEGGMYHEFMGDSTRGTLC